MDSEFAEKLKDAITQGRNNVTSYIWKGPKVKDSEGIVSQTVVPLLEASEEQLQTFYEYCNTMLYNTNPKNLGRVPLLESIAEVRDRCGAELFYRDPEIRKDSKFVVVDTLRTKVKNEGLIQAEVKDTLLGNVLAVKSEFAKLPLNLIIEAGLDQLGRFDNSNLTFRFLIRQGIWLVKGEKKEYITLKKNEKLAKIKDTLKLKQDIMLNINPVTGLSISEMKTALTISSRKYSDMSTDQLQLLRTKLLYALEDNIKLHISQWEMRKEQILEVAEIKGFNIGQK